MKVYRDINKVLWLISGIGSLPYALFVFIQGGNIQYWSLLMLGVAVIAFDGIFFPFYLLRGEVTLSKRLVSVGFNLTVATCWIYFSGGSSSLAYPHLFFLPIITSNFYGKLADAVISSIFASVVAVLILVSDRGMDWSLVISSVGPEIISFLLVGVILGYLVKAEKQERIAKQKMTEQLQEAYQRLSSSHEQLQAYTEIIQELNLEMERLAVTDELTDLYNYRYFQLCLEKVLQQCKTGSMALLMLDIDHFKEVNDEFGHQSGNKVLVEISRLIREKVRDQDVVVRYGGEEFAIILPGIDHDAAMMVAGRIREAVQNTCIVAESGVKVKVTVSLGVALYPEGANTQNDLISHADTALYRAKENGRNRVCVY
ncbi:MAG: GGDEF domain-containing protein [Bacillota bacterium]